MIECEWKGNVMAQKNTMITFEHLDMTIKHAYFLKKLYDSCQHDDMIRLFGRKNEVHSVNYLTHLSEMKTLSEKDGRCVFFVFQDGQPCGLITAFPVRDEEKLKEYALHMVLSNNELIHKIDTAFRLNMHQLLSEQMNRAQQIHVFTPARGGCMKPLYCLPYELRSKAGDSFLSCLSKTLPDSIAIDTDVILRRLQSHLKTSESVFNLFENNRYLGEKYLIGLSRECSSLVGTQSFLERKTQIHQGSLSIFYGLYDNAELVGLIEWVCKGSDASVNLIIDEKYAGKGYGSEVLRLTEQEFFMRGLQNIFMECNVQNDGAVSVLTHNKYVFEGNEADDGFYYYHKTVGHYNTGHLVSNSLLKIRQQLQSEKN